MGRKKASAPTTYEKLPQTKTKNGYKYVLVTRNDKVALYEQRVEKEINGEVGKIVGFEVFLIVVGKPYSLVQKNGSKRGQVYSYPAAEKFPSNEDGGRILWSYNTKESALAKFNELSK